MNGATWRIICADVLEGLGTLPDESVQMVVTSPPYWGLRDYGTAEWEGGDAVCDHAAPFGGGPPESSSLDGAKQRGRSDVGYRAVCGKCGAVRRDQQIGLEPTPEAYVERMVAVFREIRRVLRPDGTVWLNLGDSYASGVGGGQGANGQMADRAIVQARAKRPRQGLQGGTRTVDVSLGGGRGPGLKPKDLVGIPWRVAFALQADGWYLRADIIWAKPNPMPESVTDRPTKAHEYVFLLTRSARYFYDADAVREAFTGHDQGSNGHGEHNKDHGQAFAPSPRNTLKTHDAAGRNLRSVWPIATEPYPEAHFATFPKALVVPCVKAGSRTGDEVLDPFCGSGTVGVVALRHGRSFIGIELNPTYAEMARERIRNDAPLFNIDAEITSEVPA